MHRRQFVQSIAWGAAGIAATGSLPAGHDAAIREPADTSALSDHRIAKVEARQVADRYPRFVGRNSFGTPQGRGGTRQLRVITTDRGARAWGLAWGGDERFRHLLGAKLSDLFDPRQGPSEEALPIELPLYDLVGRLWHKPIYQLLGAVGPRDVPIYSGAIYFDDLEPADKPRGAEGVVISCRQDYESGYRAFKLKIGRGKKWMPREEGIRRDVAVTRAVRLAFPDCKILVDANNGYTLEDFLGYVDATKDCDLYGIEEPFPENREDLLRLHERMAKVGCRALIIEGEHRTDRAEKPWKWGDYSPKHIEHLFALAAEKLIHVINLDLAVLGFARWSRVMPELKAAGILASPHTWAGTPRPYYSTHLAAGVGNVVIVEGIPGRAEGVDYSAFRFVDGRLVVPDAPGFGMDLAGVS